MSSASWKNRAPGPLLIAMGDFVVGGLKKINTRSTGKSMQRHRAARRVLPRNAREFTRTREIEVDALRQRKSGYSILRLGPLHAQPSVVCGVHDFEAYGRHRRDHKAPDCPPKSAVSVPGATQ